MSRTVVVCHLNPRPDYSEKNRNSCCNKYKDQNNRIPDDCKCNNKNLQNIPQNSIQVRKEDNAILINGRLANVVRYEIIVPNKVMRVTFADGTQEKVVCHALDTFSVDQGIRIAIAKHVGRDYYNEKGIENLAERLSYLKCIDKMIDKLDRRYVAEQKAKAKKEADDREAKLREERRAKKRAEEKRRREERRVERMTSDSAEFENPNCREDKPSAVPVNHVNITKRRHSRNPKD